MQKFKFLQIYEQEKDEKTKEVIRKWFFLLMVLESLEYLVQTTKASS